jgi:serine/threonine-protein kinase RsbW
VEPIEEVLTLTFPARAGYLRICRITTTTFAADLGFDVDQLDDLRLAVDEAVTWLLKDEEAGGEVSLALDTALDEITVRGQRHSAAVPVRDVDDLVHAILGATLESYELRSEEGHRSIELRATKSGE